MQSDFDGVSMRYSFDDAKADGARKTQFYSMLGSRGIWHEGWKAVTTHPDDRRLEPLQRRHLGALPHRRRPLRAARPGEGEPGEAQGAPEPVVRGGRQERRVPARRPLAAGDHPDAAAAARAAARPVHLLPRHRRRPGAAGRQRPQPLLRHRGAGRHPGARRRGRAVRARSALRRARPLRQGQPAALREQLRRHRRAEGRRDRGRADRRGPDPRRPRSTRTARTRPAWPPASCRSTTATRRSARAASRPSRAPSRWPARACASAATAARPSPTTTPATSPHRFTGGTIKRVAVDVSGEPYLDLEREAAGDAVARVSG